MPLHCRQAVVTVRIDGDIAVAFTGTACIAMALSGLAIRVGVRTSLIVVSLSSRRSALALPTTFFGFVERQHAAALTS